MGRPLSGDGFAFVPRDVVAQPAAFGKVAGLLAPAPPHTVESERYRAAMIQHLMCATARQALLTKTGKSPAQFVEFNKDRGLGQDRVRRVFRGATMAQFTDLAFWAAHFPEVATAIAEYTATWAPEPKTEPQEQQPPREDEPTPTPPVIAQLPPRPPQRTTPQNPYSSAASRSPYPRRPTGGASNR